MVEDGEVVDGGPGDDTIRSHLTSTELATLGLTMVSIENFVLIDEDSISGETCDLGPDDNQATQPPRVSVSWNNLLTPDAVFTTTSGDLGMVLENHSADAVAVELEFVLRARGRDVTIAEEPLTIAANSTETFTLDISDFIPLEVEVGLVLPSLLVLPISASLSTSARLSVGGQYVGHSFPPTLFGHLELDTQTIPTVTTVVYREGALHDTYYHGDLGRWRAAATPYSGPTMFMARSEARGSGPLPGY